MPLSTQPFYVSQIVPDMLRDCLRHSTHFSYPEMVFLEQAKMDYEDDVAWDGLTIAAIQTLWDQLPQPLPNSH